MGVKMHQEEMHPAHSSSPLQVHHPRVRSFLTKKMFSWYALRPSGMYCTKHITPGGNELISTSKRGGRKGLSCLVFSVNTRRMTSAEGECIIPPTAFVAPPTKLSLWTVTKGELNKKWCFGLQGKKILCFVAFLLLRERLRELADSPLQLHFYGAINGTGTPAHCFFLSV